MKAKYLVIKEWILEQIKSGELSEGSPVPSEKELSERFAVSRITAKKALEELVKDDLIVRQRGKGNFVKKSNEGKQKIIAMVFPNDNVQGLWAEYMNGANKVAHPNGYFITPIFYNGSDVHATKQVIDDLMYSEVSGIIFYPTTSIRGADYFQRIAMTGYPFLLIDKMFYDVNLSSVMSNNKEGSKELIEYLIKQGHKQIISLFYDEIWEKSSTRDRYLAQVEAFETNEIDYSVIPNFSGIEDKKQAIKDLKDEGYTAIVCEHDLLANVCAMHIESLGLKNQVEIVGFDNINKLLCLDTHITTVAQNFREIGKCAVEQMIKQIEIPNTTLVSIVVDTELITI